MTPLTSDEKAAVILAIDYVLNLRTVQLLWSSDEAVAIEIRTEIAVLEAALKKLEEKEK